MKNKFRVGKLEFSITSPWDKTVSLDKCYGDIKMLCLEDTISYEGNTYRLTCIGEYAFSYSSVLSVVTIPETVTEIRDGAFKGCSSLTFITIPNSVTSIGAYAFSDCSSLASITIPNSVISFGMHAFEGSAIYNNPSNWENGALYINDCLIAVDGNFVGNYNIKENTRIIGGFAFKDCSSLTTISIPNSVTRIGWYAFSGCSALTFVIIPNSVTWIGDNAFGGCSALTSIIIPNSVTRIGRSAFSGCSALASIIIPNSLTRVESYAFTRCFALHLSLSQMVLQKLMKERSLVAPL